MSASIGRKMFAQEVLCDRHGAEKWESRGLSPEYFLWQRPLESRKMPLCKVEYSCVHYRSSC